MIEMTLALAGLIRRFTITGTINGQDTKEIPELKVSPHQIRDIITFELTRPKWSDHWLPVERNGALMVKFAERDS
jgi:hypothetical protein